MKGPPAGPYTPYSCMDPCVLKGDCISEEKPTSVDEALQAPACLWWSASPKRSTSVVQALNACQPHMLMGRPSLQKKSKKTPLAWTVLSWHENHCVPACRLHLQRKVHQCEPCLIAVLTPGGIWVGYFYQRKTISKEHTSWPQ